MSTFISNFSKQAQKMGQRLLLFRQKEGWRTPQDSDLVSMCREIWEHKHAYITQTVLPKSWWGEGGEDIIKTSAFLKIYCVPEPIPLIL